MLIHFVSTGVKFPYSYYMGVITALKTQNLPVKLWYTQKPRSKWFDKLKGKVEMERCKAPSTPAIKKLKGKEKFVAIFDYVIWDIVAREGGVIMGLDSLSLKPWDDLLGDKEMLVPKDSRKDPMSFSMHGVVVKKGSEMAKTIHQFSDLAINSDNIAWGDAGIIPYLQVVHENLDKVNIAEVGMMGDVDSVLPLFEENAELINPDARTIPLYATSLKGKFDEINEDMMGEDVLYTRLIDEIEMGKKYRFHLLGLVHLPVSEKYMGCAFTQKIVKMAKMMLSLGHEVYLYGAEGSDAPCTEFIQTHTMADIREEWGSGDNRFDLGYDWKKLGFRHDFNAPRTKTTHKYYANCIVEIDKRKRDSDFLLISQGQYQKPIADKLGLYLTCEFGIGYRGSYAKFRAFESAYLQNFTYGSENPFKSVNGNYYDRVIPNYFEEKHFTLEEEKDDYYFFIGRLIQRKGVYTAIKACEAAGVKLKIAGQGELDKDYKNVEVLGYVEPEERNKLMGKAQAVFVPTEYLEAFGGVNVEAQLCGTPVITTNFGVFPETVRHGIAGFRCNTLDDFVHAIEAVEILDPKTIRRQAEKYLMDNVKFQYQQWFDDLYQLYLSSKYPHIKGWHHIS